MSKFRNSLWILGPLLTLSACGTGPGVSTLETQPLGGTLVGKPNVEGGVDLYVVISLLPSASDKVRSRQYILRAMPLAATDTATSPVKTRVLGNGEVNPTQQNIELKARLPIGNYLFTAELSDVKGNVLTTWQSEEWISGGCGQAVMCPPGGQVINAGPM